MFIPDIWPGSLVRVQAGYGVPVAQDSRSPRPWRLGALGDGGGVPGTKYEGLKKRTENFFLVRVQNVSALASLRPTGAGSLEFSGFEFVES